MGVWEWLNGTDMSQAVDRNDLTHAQDRLMRVSKRDKRESDDFLFWNRKVNEGTRRTSAWDWWLGAPDDRD